ncbi:RagB/SusD family nutrient uptake outer membrane protein [Flavisolibacter ginsenosidimutans]|uniref:RagB/SusD family nutrient uptake outer membrane protein n=1 Tax=Flavisolibacter ginsenosidimutans TaxID=661481 RepID=A0A5B8UIV1_9BACT|nr:RagB/SusD family nutrient uptake outer membrane protein [Flavisolibacter ginsenosidimutans]QEC56316.1 RagB/SusD family nutrient uptake outer membrane protein [Flavisolibacter ginsenosidimutans]
MKRSFKTYTGTNVRLKRFHYGLLALLLGFTACKKELEEHPKSIAVETFYNTATEVETAVNAIYPPLRSTNIMGSYLSELEPYVDYGDARGSFAVLNDFQGLNATHISRTDQAWSSFYLSIRNANLVIANAPNGKDISQADVKKYIAEAKFLRAFNYFHLVRSWGGVPIHTEANLAETDVKKSTPADVYNLIVADLQDAETNLPDKPAQLGRPSKWAAKTLLADVYLQLKKYTEARDKSDEVIKANKYALVPVATVDDWQKIFSGDAGVTTEEIFYIEFTRQSGYGSIWPMYLNHPGTKLLRQGGYYGFHSYTTNPVYQNQDNNDLRKGLWYVWNIGMGPNTTLNKKFIDQIATNGAGNPATWYRYADLLLIYAEAASRANNGPTVNAMEALNQVHRRAYGKNPNTPSSVDFKLADYDANSFLDLVIRERGYEFVYEGKRWLTLKRTGKAQEIIGAVKGKTIAEKCYLFPIPASEFNFNKALDPTKDQNPGY